MPFGFLRVGTDLKLEQAGNLTGLGVDVNAAVCGVSSSTGHHGDGTSHGAQELSAAVLQNVTDEQTPAGGNTLLGGIVGQGQVGLNHHGAVVSVLGIGLEALSLLHSQRQPNNAVSAVDFLSDQLDALTQGHLQIVQELDFHGILTSLNNDLCQLSSAFAAETPVVGLGATDTALSTQSLQQSDFSIGIGEETVNADNGVDAGLLDGVDMVEQVAGTLFQQFQVLLSVLLGQGCARG